MEKLQFKDMWERMQSEGYFRDHEHYADWHPDRQDALHFDPDKIHLNGEPDALFRGTDFSAMKIMLPAEYSVDLGRAIKKNEYYWLPRLVDLPRDGTLLDLGCGYGRSIEWLHKVCRNVIGVDISDYAIAIARQRFQAIDNVEFYVCDGNSLPPGIGDHSVDLVYSFTVFQHIPRHYTLDYLRDCVRVLRPTGKILFNLLSGVNEHLDIGPEDTEWEIGYTSEQANALVAEAGLQLCDMTEILTLDCTVSWLWIEAGL